jgi:hypothetical protein
MRLTAVRLKTFICKLQPAYFTSGIYLSPQSSVMPSLGKLSWDKVIRHACLYHMQAITAVCNDPPTMPGHGRNQQPRCVEEFDWSYIHILASVLRSSTEAGMGVWAFFIGRSAVAIISSMPHQQRSLSGSYQTSDGHAFGQPLIKKASTQQTSKQNPTH